MLHQGLNGSSSEMDLGDLAQLPAGLSQIAGGLNEVAGGLTKLNQNYSVAFSALNDTINKMPLDIY